MTLTRRANAGASASANTSAGSLVTPPGESRGRSGSTIWEDEANQYWQSMEPAARQRGRGPLLRYVILAAVLCSVGGLAVSFRLGGGPDAWIKWTAGLSARFPLPAVSFGRSEAVVGVPDETESRRLAQAADSSPSPMANAAMDQAAVEQLRARCRVRGVQTRWHEETCRKMCLRDPQQSACMNGCSYGSITVTKLTCDEAAALTPSIPSAAAPSSTTRCPDGVNCVGACRAYDREKPFPAARSSCERGCSSVVPAACTRVLQIFRDLERGAIQ